MARRKQRGTPLRAGTALRLGAGVQAAALLAVVLVLIPLSSHAQYLYGKNKVTYHHRDWKVLKTAHVDIYHYPDEENLVRYIAPLVEATFLEYEERFDLEFEKRLPFVFYKTHYAFQETNILPQLISEYTGGFTDLMKGRIAVPFTGSYGEFRHVARHEMAHAFMLEKIRVVMKKAGKYTYPPPPLWFIEGMAEYFANSPQNTQSRMFVRDAIVNDKLLPLDQIWRIEGSFMMYKQGEAVLNYISTSFGEDAIVQILENWWVSDNFTMVLKTTINMDLIELSDAFIKNAKRRYYPAILHSQFASDIGTQLTPEGNFHSRPTVTRDNDGETRLYSLCAQDWVINVCEIEKPGKRDFKRKIIVPGSRSSDVESIPAFRSKLEAVGDSLLFVAKSKSRDVIYIWDRNRRKKVAQFKFDGLTLLSSPTMSGDRRKLVFSAINAMGSMDLYLYDLGTKKLEQLTDDGFSEDEPDFHPTRNEILFTSDRDARGRYSHTGIYKMDLDTREIVEMTGGWFSDSNPEWAPDGDSFLFTSDRDGAFDIYHHRGDSIVRQTNVLGGATSPAFLPDGRGFVAEIYTDQQYLLYEFPLKNGHGTPTLVARGDSVRVGWRSLDETDYQYETSDYHVKMGIDFIAAGVAFSPEFGEVGNGAQMVLTDVLGNHQLYLVAGNTSEGFDNFWRRMNAAVTYVNLSHRLHYSLGVFHLNNTRVDPVSLGLTERRFGGALGVSLPLDFFRRVEASIVLEQFERALSFDTASEPIAESFLGTLFLTYVSDKTLWTIGGPLTGWRWYVRGGRTHDFLSRGFTSTSVHVDIRRYFKITQRIVFANRFHYNSLWGGAQRLFYLGGPWDLRGYDFRQFIGRTTYLFNSEIRFPLIDRFALQFPFGALEIPMFRGAVFMDVGKVTRFIYDSDLLGSFGAGVELNLGFAPVVRVNWTRQTDFRTISARNRWELFIGYNY
jgi:hypothetical protein